MATNDKHTIANAFSDDVTNEGATTITSRTEVGSGVMSGVCADISEDISEECICEERTRDYVENAELVAVAHELRLSLDPPHQSLFRVVCILVYEDSSGTTLRITGECLSLCRDLILYRAGEYREDRTILLSHFSRFPLFSVFVALTLHVSVRVPAGSARERGGSE